MEKDKLMPFHEAANIFPMDNENIESLSKDIKENGQYIPIEIHEGQIIDGRRRYMACRLANVTPSIRNVSPEDPVSYVLSLNLHRRQLNESQRGMCAARAKEIYARQAKERQATSTGGIAPQLMENLPQAGKGSTRDAAGKAFSVSGKTVDHASRVLKSGTQELIAAVDSGRVAVSTAAFAATESPEKQKEVVDNAANRDYSKMKPRKSDSVDHVDILPKHAGEHTQSELFAMNKADVAITQLKGIPVSNDHRNAALEKVTRWINSQRKK